ncbi:hypothetical protein CMI37_22075 [Candidatus Pacearchaeota archaeon]|nr:hypothetical protein [Candidatus Pacearchaeota archaeon]|tara:strand:- start:192 stop:635 length:444 start_codon:yes stop_codon:yes gene_type:complete
MIYVLYGQPGSGKTTLGKLIADHLDTPFIIDGDEFRKMFTLRATDKYGVDGREENIKNANAVATYLNKKSNPNGHVVMSLVNPYASLRSELKENNADEVTEILLTTSRSDKNEYHVEDFESGSPDHRFNTDREAEYNWSKLRTLLKL